MELINPFLVFVFVRELKKQVEFYKSKIAELEANKKDTTKHLNSTANSDKRIVELELALSKMRQQQELLQKEVRGFDCGSEATEKYVCQRAESTQWERYTVRRKPGWKAMFRLGDRSCLAREV